jgi:hypothetical protein
MNTSDLVDDLRNTLNRPDGDDLFEFPADYHTALSRANRHFIRKTVAIYPELLYESATVTSSDSGATYDLTDDHLGELQVWAPPGPPRGLLLLPSMPYGNGNYWLEGRKIKMVTNKYYSQGLTILWVPATIADLGNDVNSPLPDYFRDAMVAQAAAYMVRKPGIALDPDTFFYRARNEWSGDARDASDVGIIGILRRQNAMGAYQTVESGYHPWYHGMGG